jgi:hypothetical protein
MQTEGNICPRVLYAVLDQDVLGHYLREVATVNVRSPATYKSLFYRNLNCPCLKLSKKISQHLASTGAMNSTRFSQGVMVQSSISPIIAHS